MKKQYMLPIILIIFLFTAVIFKPRPFYFEPLNIQVIALEKNENVLDEMTNQMLSMGYEGEIKSNLEIYALKTGESLKKNNIQLYRVQLDYAMADHLAIYKKGIFQGMIPHMTLHNIYVTDLDNNGGFELLTQSAFGSGLYYIQLSMYDLESNLLMTSHFYNKNDGIFLKVVDKKIMAYDYDFSFDRISEKPIGEVHFDETITIDNMETNFNKVVFSLDL